MSLSIEKKKSQRAERIASLIHKACGLVGRAGVVTGSLATTWIAYKFVRFDDLHMQDTFQYLLPFMGIVSGVVGAFLQIKIESFMQFRSLANPPCRRLWWASALIPGPYLRKRIRKMLADQEHEIDALINDKRFLTAKWLCVCTWILFFTMILTGPVVALLKMMSRLRST